MADLQEQSGLQKADLHWCDPQAAAVSDNRDSGPSQDPEVGNLATELTSLWAANRNSPTC